MKNNVSAIQSLAHCSHGLDLLHMRQFRYIARQKTASACDEVATGDGDDNERRFLISDIWRCSWSAKLREVVQT